MGARRLFFVPSVPPVGAEAGGTVLNPALLTTHLGGAAHVNPAVLATTHVTPVAIATPVFLGTVHRPPLTIPHLRPPVTAGINNIHIVRPPLAALIGTHFLQDPYWGVTRDQVTAPVSMDPNPTGASTFEDARNASQKFYLPEYRLGEETVSGNRRYRVLLEQDQTGGSLTVFLEKQAPAAFASSGAQELPHSFVILLGCRIGSGTARKEFQFSEYVAEPSGIRATLRFTGLTELDQAYRALTESAQESSLFVRRVARLAVKVDVAPRIEKLQSEVAEIDGKVGVLRAQEAQLSAHIAALSAIPFGGGNTAGLQEKREEIRREIAKAEEQKAAKTQELDRLRAAPIFRERDVAVDHTVDPRPFAFPPAVHPYVTADVTPGASSGIEFLRRTLPWNGRHHVYLQESRDSHLFYYLPDAFKLARRPETPHPPMLTVEVVNPQASAQETQLSVIYYAAPEVDAARLEAAAQGLKPFLPGHLPAGVTGPVLQPVLGASPKLLLAYPRADMSTGPFEHRDKAAVDLEAGIRDALVLSLERFQPLYDALFGGSDVLLLGEVQVDAGGEVAEKVPVVLRMSDTVGDVLDYREEAEPGSGGLRIWLKNAIESPVRLTGLQARLVRGEASVAAAIQGDEWPVDLAPGAEMTLTLTAASPLAGEGPVSGLLDLASVEVQPDPEKVWDVLFEGRRPPEYTRKIRVKGFASLFAAPAAQPERQVEMIVVSFEDGTATDLSAEKLESAVDVRIPLADYVLRHAGSGEYRYKLTVVRRSGVNEDADWRKGSSEILVPIVN